MVKIVFVNKDEKPQNKIIDKKSASLEKEVLINNAKEKTKTEFKFIDKSKEYKPFYTKNIDRKKTIKEPIEQKEVVQKPVVQKPVVQKPVVQKPVVQEPIKEKITVTKQVIKKCPFNDGDLIKSKDQIYLVVKLDDNYYIQTDVVLKMKKIIPNDWGIFNKI